MKSSHRIPRPVDGDECGAGARGMQFPSMPFSDAPPCRRDDSLWSTNWICTTIKLYISFAGGVGRFRRRFASGTGSVVARSRVQKKRDQILLFA